MVLSPSVRWDGRQHPPVTPRRDEVVENGVFVCLWAYQSEFVCVCVFSITHLYDVPFKHAAQPSHVLQQFYSAVAVLCRIYEKWGHMKLFLALKSMCCHEASRLYVDSDHLTHAQAVDFKDMSLPLAGRCDGAVKKDE